MADYDSEILRKLQLTILEILKDIDKVCKENDIEYSKQLTCLFDRNLIHSHAF